MMTTSVFERGFPVGTPPEEAKAEALAAFEEQAARTYESHQLVGEPVIVDSPAHAANGELLVRIHADVGKRLPHDELQRRADQAAPG